MYNKVGKTLQKKRVVVTGLSMISPLGVGMQENWNNILLNKKNFQSNEEQRFLHRIECKYGARLPPAVFEDEFIKKYQKKMNMHNQTIPNGLLKEALVNADLLDEEEMIKVDRTRTGIAFSSIVDANENILYNEWLKNNQNLSVLAFWIVGAIALDYGINGYPGLNDLMSGSSLMLVGDSYRMIQLGYQDVMVVGGFDQNVGTYYHEMLEKQGYLNKYTKHDANEVLRPYDAEAMGTVPGDGGAYVVLEEEEHARKRGVPILAEVVGYTQAIGSFHVFLPKPETIQVPIKCVVDLLDDVQWAPSDLDLISGSGSGYRNEDDIEITALRSALGSSPEDLAKRQVTPEEGLDLSQAKNVVINSMKGNLGHLGIASGIAELALTLKAQQEGKVLGTANLKKPQVTDLNFALDGTTRDQAVDKFVKLSYGHGMNCSAVAFQKYVQ